MLRFTRTLELVLHQKESSFSKEFWKGLGFALTFHVMLFVVFRIASLPNLDTLKPLMPVHVEIDLGQRETTASLPSQIMQAPFEKLALPSHSFVDIPSYYTKKTKRSLADFSEIEKIEYLPLEDDP